MKSDVLVSKITPTNPQKQDNTYDNPLRGEPKIQDVDCSEEPRK